MQPGDRVQVMPFARLEPFAGRTGTLEALAAGVQGRHRVRLDTPAGMHESCDMHENELRELPVLPVGPDGALPVYLPADHAAILRSRSQRPRAAARFRLPAWMVNAIQDMRLSADQVWDLIYPPGVRVRLNTPMDGETVGPKAGETGPLRHANVSTDTVQLSVAWPGGSHLMAIAPRDNITLLAPAAPSA